jgi:hypothetical protein
MGNNYIYRDRIVVRPPVQNIVIFPPISLATPALGYSGVTDLVLELVDHGKRFRCAALIDTGATGLFISRDYAMHVQTWLHQLESLVTVQNVDSTKN